MDSSQQDTKNLEVFWSQIASTPLIVRVGSLKGIVDQ
jgi:hypothetical protein